MKISQAKDAPHALAALPWDNGHMHIIFRGLKIDYKKCVGSKWNSFKCVSTVSNPAIVPVNILTGR